MIEKEIELRDWFAGMALQALMINGMASNINGKKYEHDIAAYKYADAMMEARKG